MAEELPQSILFCCDHNAVRSPMAEALTKKLFGGRIFVQSTGVKHDMEVDGFAVAVCEEIDVDLSDNLFTKNLANFISSVLRYEN